VRVGEVFPYLNLSSSVAQIEIKGISCHHKYLDNQDMFFIIKGKNFDIFKILKKIEKKTAIFVAEREDKEKIEKIIKKRPVIFLENIKEELKKAIDRVYKGVVERFKFILVTGTNGKTTTAYLIYQLLKKFNLPSIFIGTVGYYFSDKEKEESLLTTPDYLLLRRLLAQQKNSFVVMEASSQGIKENRLEGLFPVELIFTNLSRDHLDYHKNMHDYFSAKKKLFLDNPEALALINIDNLYGRRLFSQIENKKFSYGSKKSAYYRIEIKKIAYKKSYFDIFSPQERESFSTSLLGRINIENLSAAIASLNLLGFSLKEIKKKTSFLKLPRGRLEEVAPSVFVDYAHTPSALKNVLLTLREVGYRRIICVFGCGGNRDKGKRKLMGKIASLYADFSIITSDNPRNEDPRKILEEIKKGFIRNNFTTVVDRKKAIEKALKLKRKNDCVLIAGKGHERYQIIGEKRIPFDDCKVVKNFLKK